ncbi:MAG: hypothetical protein Q9N02_11750 [Ghiorsea sp.]|nr:hypothetical protein [Ghiorsea sp.]
MNDAVIRNHIEQSKVKNIIFVLVATPVEEVGRDHDFDWAVIEPSSYRSFVQMAGRVLRHRDKEVQEPNIAIMKYNYRALKTGGKKVAFRWPGYQNQTKDLTSYDLDKLVNTQELAENLDATNRIKQTQSSELASLEHKVIHELLTNYEEKGPESMQGWLDSDWWLTGIPQHYIKFRNSSQDLTVFLTGDNELKEKGDKGSTVSIGKDSVTFAHDELHNLWLKRDYQALLKEQVRKTGMNVKQVELIYGEINLPTYGEPLGYDQFIYHEQLGVIKE